MTAKPVIATPVELQGCLLTTGNDEDVMNEDIRLAEVRNWIEQLVLPNMGR